MGHYSKNKNKTNKGLIFASFIIYFLYSFLGIWFKGCVHDIKDEIHTKRTCTKIAIYLFIGLKICDNSMLSYSFFEGNKTGISFVIMLFVICFVHLNLNFIIYCFKIELIVSTYWLGFLFYQFSRLCVLIFFILSIIFKSTHIETYIYAFILCIILIHMYFANYFNTLKKDISYKSYVQAMFNYPFEWMNMFCCCCTNHPNECIKKIDKRCCYCDTLCLTFFQLLLMLIFYVF